MRLPINQRGISQIILPLFLFAAIGLAVYLVQQQTELTPSAQEIVTTAPTGCEKVTPSNRKVRYKNCSSSAQECPADKVTNLIARDGEEDVNIDWIFDGKKVSTYALKEIVWDFGSNWKGYTTKGPRRSDGDRYNTGKPRFDGPGGKSYHETDTDEITTGTLWRVKYGDGQVVEYAYSSPGTNYQGLPGSRYDETKSYAFVPTDPNSDTKCDGTGSGSTGSKAANAVCERGTECKSGVCTNKKCASQGNKAGGSACRDGIECQSGKCSNDKCEGGTKSTGSACEDDSDCASNICGSNDRCVAPSPSPARTASPRASAAGGAASTAPSASGSPAASTPAASAPTASTPPGTSPVRLTKAEITGFKNNYDALATRLGSVASGSGNLQIVSGIAGSELNSIVSQLPTCPDDANVGTCLDTKFRTRFDLAKTAARLAAFYGTFNGVKGICVKSDLGLNPLITGTSQTGVTGRVNLCTDRLVGTRIWMIFAGGAFTPILSTDTRFPANPSCQNLPADVMTHYRNAETLFNTQPGFLQNTLCDGKTLVVPGGGT